jgi:phosphoribosyl 1,2-cyclic phosphodiesterase
VEICRRMQAAGLEIKRLNAIVVSHEHNDHVRGVGVMARRYDLPIYISPGTAKGAKAVLGRIDKMVSFESGQTFAINGLLIHPFATTHDARDSAGFTITANGHKMGIATDLGIATGMVKQHLSKCELMVLEANHDPRMLVEGPYPWPLKQRIQGRNGHLSNQASRDLLGEIKHSDLCHVILAHLSEINNTPEKALAEVAQAITAADRHIQLHVARQDCCSDLLVLR